MSAEKERQKLEEWLEGNPSFCDIRKRLEECGGSPWVWIPVAILICLYGCKKNMKAEDMVVSWSSWGTAILITFGILSGAVGILFYLVTRIRVFKKISVAHMFGIIWGMIQLHFDLIAYYVITLVRLLAYLPATRPFPSVLTVFLPFSRRLASLAPTGALLRGLHAARASAGTDHVNFGLLAWRRRKCRRPDTVFDNARTPLGEVKTRAHRRHDS